MRPSSTCARATAAATEASEVTSQAIILMPSRISPGAALRLVPITRYPARLSANAAALPIPLEAPVTNAVFCSFDATVAIAFFSIWRATSGRAAFDCQGLVMMIGITGAAPK